MNNINNKIKNNVHQHPSPSTNNQPKSKNNVLNSYNHFYMSIQTLINYKIYVNVVSYIYKKHIS